MLYVLMDTANVKAVTMVTVINAKRVSNITWHHFELHEVKGEDLSLSQMFSHVYSPVQRVSRELSFLFN